jgi:hypothetical protein
VCSCSLAKSTNGSVASSVKSESNSNAPIDISHNIRHYIDDGTPCLFVWATVGKWAVTATISWCSAVWLVQSYFADGWGLHDVVVLRPGGKVCSCYANNEKINAKSVREESHEEINV